jgi:adenylate cyclase class 2
MLEIEQKFRVTDHAAVRAALDRLEAAAGGEQAEADHYFNAPDRDFAATGEAFRLRRVGERNVLTYKGPKQPGPVKTRPEVELVVAPGDDGAATTTALLHGLGFRPVAAVRKRRASFTVAGPLPATVCLDAVDRLGTFVEVEVLAEDAQAAAAQAVVRAVANELGLSDPEPRSYLRMLLEAGG